MENSNRFRLLSLRLFDLTFAPAMIYYGMSGLTNPQRASMARATSFLLIVILAFTHLASLREEESGFSFADVLYEVEITSRDKEHASRSNHVIITVKLEVNCALDHVEHVGIVL